LSGADVYIWTFKGVSRLYGKQLLLRLLAQRLFQGKRRAMNSVNGSVAPKVTLAGITKTFPGVIANQDVDAEFFPYEIHALLGENGAGKTTLMNMLCGIYRQDNGKIILDDKIVHFTEPRNAIDSGIGMVHQHFRLVNAFTVAENLHFGWENTPKTFSRKDLRQRAIEVIEKYGFDVSIDSYVHQLSAGEQQRVEILKVLSRGAKVLIFDEPTAVLTPNEATQLFENLRRLADDGHCIIVISHKLREVLAHTDRITVLRCGRNTGTDATKNFNEQKLASLMVGREIGTKKFERPAVAKSQKVAELKSVSALSDLGTPALRDVNLTIHSGEILGIAGVAGNGQRDLSEVLTGIRKVTSGEVWVDNTNMTGKSPSDFLKMGLGFSPEDRLRSGLAASASIANNTVVREYRHSPIGKNGMFSPSAARSVTNSLLKEANVTAPSLNAPVSGLSGGNQQRLIMRREIRIAKKLLITVYPTRGLDVAAVQDIQKQLIERRNSGVGVILISEELDEIFAICDRIAVLFNGKILGEFKTEDCSLLSIGHLMGGVMDDEVVQV
jgi:general nucleoside transport system ATP-binding protein